MSFLSVNPLGFLTLIYALFVVSKLRNIGNVHRAHNIALFGLVLIQLFPPIGEGGQLLLHKILFSCLVWNAN